MSTSHLAIGDKVAFGGESARIRANFVPIEAMTDEQLREHLMEVHGFSGYEDMQDEPYYLRTADRTQLELKHGEDHAQYDGGGGNGAGAFQHVHNKPVRAGE